MSTKASVQGAACQAGSSSRPSTRIGPRAREQTYLLGATGKASFSPAGGEGGTLASTAPVPAPLDPRIASSIAHAAKKSVAHAPSWSHRRPVVTILVMENWPVWPPRRWKRSAAREEAAVLVHTQVRSTCPARRRLEDLREDV